MRLVLVDLSLPRRWPAILNSRALDFGMVTGHPRVACLLDGLQRSLAGVRRGSAGEEYLFVYFRSHELR